MHTERINTFSSSDLASVVKIHLERLHESFLTRFGEPFLRVFYVTAISLDSSIVLVTRDAGCVVGFLFAVTDRNLLYRKLIRSAFFILIFHVLRVSLFHPRIIFLLVEWMVVPLNPRFNHLPELQFLAVDGENQNKGIGSNLLEALDTLYISLGIHSYIVGTKATNVLSNRFYLKKGFVYINQEYVFGEMQSFYEKNI
jgi:ribosomal protein S18 acetylase RimI-like enzyme